MSVGAPDGLMAALRGRPCWVVGCGFLGAELLGLARSLGMQALGIDACHPLADVRGDAAQAAVLAQARARLEPELIFCCVATHGGDEAAYRTAYLEVPRALHAACPAARLVFCSSVSVYGGQGGELVAEGAACRAASARARLLLEAEGQVRAWGGVVARLAPLYGPGRCELLRRHVQREPELPGPEERVLSYVNASDAARGLLLMAVAAAPGEVLNVSHDSFTKGEVYEALCGLTALPRVGVAAAAGRRGQTSQRVSAARLEALGWRPEWDFLRWAARHLGKGA